MTAWLRPTAMDQECMLNYAVPGVSSTDGNGSHFGCVVNSVGECVMLGQLAVTS